MSKQLTNVQRVKKMMENNGPLGQMFVLDAIDKHTQRIMKLTKNDWPQNHIINFDAWQDTAKQLREELDA